VRNPKIIIFDIFELKLNVRWFVCWNLREVFPLSKSSISQMTNQTFIEEWRYFGKK